MKISTQTPEQLEKKGFEPYDIGRSLEQTENILQGVKTAYRGIVVVKTTIEAHAESFPYTIYVDHKTIIR